MSGIHRKYMEEALDRLEQFESGEVQRHNDELQKENYKLKKDIEILEQNLRDAKLETARIGLEIGKALSYNEMQEKLTKWENITTKK